MRDDGEERGEREGKQREIRADGQIRVDELRKKKLWSDVPHSIAEINLRRKI